MSFATLLQFTLPRWFTIRVAKILGVMSFYSFKKRRDQIYENLTHILGSTTTPKKLRYYAIRTFINYAICMADLLRAPLITNEKLLKMVQVTGIENLNQTLTKGKGVVLCTAHIGNWDFAGIFMSKLNYKLVAAVEPIPQGFTEMMNRYRGLGGMELVPLTDKNYMAEALVKKKILVLLADRDLTGRGFELPCFNAKRSFPKGPAAFALRLKIPIIFGYFVLNPNSGKPYIGEIESEFKFPETDDYKEDVYNLTQLITQRINQLITKYPDQWFVFRADWR